VSKNRIHGSNASSLRQCPRVADEDPENIRTTSMMDDCNARALTPLRKSSIGVLSPRHQKASRDKQFRLAFFPSSDLFRPQGRVASRDLAVPYYPIPFFGSWIRGCFHPPALPPSAIHPELVRATRTHFGP